MAFKQQNMLYARKKCWFCATIFLFDKKAAYFRKIQVKTKISLHRSLTKLSESDFTDSIPVHSKSKTYEALQIKFIYSYKKNEVKRATSLMALTGNATLYNNLRRIRSFAARSSQSGKRMCRLRFLAKGIGYIPIYSGVPSRVLQKMFKWVLPFFYIYYKNNFLTPRLWILFLFECFWIVQTESIFY